MADKLLTQQEIEALMSALAAQPEASVAAPAEVAEPARVVKVYDFRRPDKFSKDHLRALRQIHKAFARGLVSSLTSYLRTAIQVRLTLVEQVPYDEYVGSLPNPTVIYLVTPAPLPGQILVELNLPVARVILDRLLGGSGRLNGQPREITEIELALLRKLGQFLLSNLCDAWESVVRLDAAIEDPVLRPEFIHGALQTETSVMLVFEVALLKTTGTLSICIPHTVLQPIMERLMSQMWATRAAHRTHERAAVETPEQLGGVVLPLTVELGQTRLLVRDLLALAPGDVIKLDTAAGGDLRVRVGGRVKFAGRPGLVGKNLAVQITQHLA